MNKRVFVFGSNERGAHGKGAALEAYKKHKARYGMGYGHYGDSFAIPTMDTHLKPLPIAAIKAYVDGFKAYASGRPDLTFQVTQIGCGLAGFTKEEIAPLFVGATFNVMFDTAWSHILGENHAYWGTYDDK